MLMTARSAGMVISFPSCSSVMLSSRSLPLNDLTVAFMILRTLLSFRFFTFISSALNSGRRCTIVVSVTESAINAISMALLPPPNITTLLPTRSSFCGRM